MFLDIEMAQLIEITMEYKDPWQFDDLVQDCGNSIANTLGVTAVLY